TTTSEQQPEVNEYLATLNEWFTERNLELSSEKSSTTLFTTWTKEVNTTLRVKINNNLIPTVKYTKILGITLDNLLTFSEHLKLTQNKTQKRNNVLKAIAGSTWGKDKETLVTTFKAICRPIVHYAAPIWTPQASKTNFNKLQVTQNTALRVATGCHMMTNIDHLHQETKIIPVKPHNDLLSRQYLLGCMLPHHTCNDIVNDPPPPRTIKKNLVNTYLPDLQNKYHVNSPLCQDTYKPLMQQIHQDTVTTCLGNYSPNRVLHTNTPPEIDVSEKLLPRHNRVILAQLRSGWCYLLQNYKAKIDRTGTVDSRCPKCRTSEHNVIHLFNCPANPTHLEPEDLWSLETSCRGGRVSGPRN
ncbi:hypothetical protein WDU94_002708, partial [Cyamophila willieti]